MAKAPVGWFVDNENKLVRIIPEDGQSEEEAIEEESKKHNVDKTNVQPGEAPSNYEEVWKEKTGKTEPEKKENEEPNHDTAQSTEKQNPADKAPPIDEAEGATVTHVSTTKESPAQIQTDEAPKIDLPGINNEPKKTQKHEKYSSLARQLITRSK